MQLYAFNSHGQLIHARKAFKQMDYQCLECQQKVRLRGGPQRQPHFFHLEPTLFCRQHQKGPIHLQIQAYFLQQLPFNDCLLEHPFPSIHRIADVAWLSQKIVFEIQCSPITAEEVLSRNHDYQQAGWKVVWILHDQRYNQIRLSAAELALHSAPHFFSNMDQEGLGIIYDQFDLCQNGVRVKRLPPLPINVRELLTDSLNDSIFPLIILKQRLIHWDCFFAGDLMSLFCNMPNAEYLQQAKEIEQQYSVSKAWTWRHFPALLWKHGFVKPYQIFFHFLLEKMCR